MQTGPKNNKKKKAEVQSGHKLTGPKEKEEGRHKPSPFTHVITLMWETKIHNLTQQ
jgi:hypothetical protein